MAKQSSKKHAQNKFALFRQKHITHPKLIVVLLVLLALPLFSFIGEKYKDWDNAQVIKGIAKDFPILITDIEKETGLELEIKTNCMTTSEKFSAGVKTCEILALAGVDSTKKSNQITALVSRVEGFKLGEEYENDRGFVIYYNRFKTCGVGFNARGDSTTSLSCVIGVRNANTQLALDLF